MHKKGQFCLWFHITINGQLPNRESTIQILIPGVVSVSASVSVTRQSSQKQIEFPGNKTISLHNIVLKHQLIDWYQLLSFCFLSRYYLRFRRREAEIVMSSFGQDFQQFNSRSTKAQVDLSSISSGNLLWISQHPG